MPHHMNTPVSPEWFLRAENCENPKPEWNSCSSIFTESTEEAHTDRKLPICSRFSPDLYLIPNPRLKKLKSLTPSIYPR